MPAWRRHPRRSGEVCLCRKADSHAPLSKMAHARAALGVHARFETRHLRSGGGAIDLRHTLLACT